MPGYTLKRGQRVDLANSSGKLARFQHDGLLGEPRLYQFASEMVSRSLPSCSNNDLESGGTVLR